MRTLRPYLLILMAWVPLAPPAFAQDHMPDPGTAQIQLPMHVGGRVTEDPKGGTRSQWPGIYYEASFSGTEVTARTTDKHTHLLFYVDGQPALEISRPDKRDFHFGPLRPGPHTIRVEQISETAGGTLATFSGFFVNRQAMVMPPPAPRSRQIEFIGDSYTVGYGNRSSTRACTQDEIWERTDTSAAFGPQTARHFNADYQINAMSGHGLVRNYSGSPGDTVPNAYPFVLFNTSMPYSDKTWHPQLMVIGLGTNDLSTSLNSGEKWTSRDQLHRDFEQSYIEFIHTLRSQNPQAYLILMATDQFNGEIAAEVRAVVATLRQAGESRIDFLPMVSLSFSACDWHPSVADDKQVSQSLISFIDSHPDIWPTP